MSDSQSLAVHPSLIAALIVTLVGFAAFWANPRRLFNCAFFTVSLHVAGWLVCRYFAYSGNSVVFWVRAAFMVAAFLPLHLWLLRETVVGSFGGLRTVLKASLPWSIAALVMASLAPTYWLIPAHSTPEHPDTGFGFWVYLFVQISAYVLLWRDTAVKLKTQTGVARIELQVLLMGGSATALAVLALLGTGRLVDSRVVSEFQAWTVLVFYGLTALAMTTHRIFDARYLMRLVMQRLGLVCFVAGIGYVAGTLLMAVFPEVLAFVGTTAIMLASAVRVDSFIDRFTGRFPRLVQARSAIIESSRSVAPVAELRKRFCEIISGWAQTDEVCLWFREDGVGNGGTGFWSVPIDVVSALGELRWATPERFARERSTGHTDALSRFLRQSHLGLACFAKGATLEIVVGLGIRPSRRPYTFPEVIQLQEIASIIENALGRSVLASKAQQAERLATVGLMGASVAHEIRNPLVSIKTFVQLFPIHYQDENFRTRFSRLIGGEVARIERLTEQLLDLASPRKYESQATPLHEVLRSGLEVVASKAEDKHTEVRTIFNASPDVVWTDANAVKQVVLNLCFNAIQAQESQERDRWVLLATSNVPRGIELTVTDNGPGIAPEIRARLFEAFQTTKSSGFGLGLAICSEILSSLDASISVDPFIAGQGATFRVVFPCPPRSS
jgi:signal transduction histidine kinase